MLYLEAPGLQGVPDAQVVETCCAEIAAEFVHAQAASKTVLLANFATVHARVQQYVAASGNPAKLGSSPFPRSAKGAAATGPGDLLFKRYCSGSSSDATIVAHVMKKLPACCPYCGLPMHRKPAAKNPDRDHILPRSVYPEFSILRLNLVPVCDACNEAKLEQCLDDQGDWMFLHPYFDSFLSNCVLDVTAHADAGSISLRFVPSPSVPTAERERLARHMKALDIEMRLADSATREVLNVLRAVRVYWLQDQDLARVRSAIIAAADPLLQHHANDPVGLALKAIAAGPTGDFIELSGR